MGLADEALLTVAANSHVQSEADLMVANTLEGASYAFVGPRGSTRPTGQRTCETIAYRSRMSIRAELAARRTSLSGSLFSRRNCGT